jgi:hypothetical protein
MIPGLCIAATGQLSALWTTRSDHLSFGGHEFFFIMGYGLSLGLYQRTFPFFAFGHLLGHLCFVPHVVTKVFLSYGEAFWVNDFSYGDFARPLNDRLTLFSS